MPAGQFLGDLASGIFSRRNELQQQQQTRDYNQQEGLVRMLAGLVDKVEDPSLLMGHIWDTMGIKPQGKGGGLRGFLNAFSGMPDRSMEDQLGSKFRQLTQSFMGAGEAKDIRARSQVAQKGLPYPGGYAPPTPGPFMDKAKADQARLDKSIVFRNPYGEELNKIQSRYSAALAAQQARQDDAQAAALLRQELAHKYNTERDAARYKQQTNKAIDALANAYSTHENVIQHHPSLRGIAARQMAMDTLGERENLTNENLRQNIGIKRAIIEEKGSGGGSPSVKLGQKRFEYTQYKDRNEILEDISKSQQVVDSLTPDVDKEYKAIDDYAKNVLKMSGAEELMGSRYKSIGGVAKMIQRYNEAKNKKEAAQKDVETKIRLRDDFDRMQKGLPPLKPSPPPKAQKRGASPISGLNLNKSFNFNEGLSSVKVKAVGDAAGWVKGQIVTPSYLQGRWIVEEDVSEKGTTYKFIRRVQ